MGPHCENGRCRAPLPLCKNARDRTHAAREPGISLRTLQYRLKEYGIG
ncbi:MAG: hypothetical protein C0504_04465 [Candidatus Solibacter sp.]|nr:hypothetical protein [Candidatus Solibacter sp.]